MRFATIILLVMLNNNVNAGDTEETIVLGGGCFWCTEAVFSRINGVLDVTPGYAGGNTTNPTYSEVCSGETGHAEVIKIKYDTEKIALNTLLEVFFSTHDPTTLNRQGADVGTQYRSVIFYTSEKQKNAAMQMVEIFNNEKRFTNRIVTEIMPLSTFYEAENYHNDYYDKNSRKPYCQFVIAPKLEKLEKNFNLFIQR